MDNYVAINKRGDELISLQFVADSDVPFALGKKMSEIYEEAHMNGYNWEAFFKHYLSKSNPKFLEGASFASEIRNFIIYFQLTKENEVKLQKISDTIKSLVNNEAEVLRIVKEESGEIEWD